MDKQINILETLDWYLWAGVNETCADKACLAEAVTENTASATANIRNTNTVNLQNHQNTPGVSIASTSAALKNAEEACAKATTLDELRDILACFEGCNLKKTATNTVFGDGCKSARIMLIGEAPGADEDRQGKPFVGRCGKLLDKMLKAIDIERSACFITNVLPWRPPGNRPPTDDEIAVCLPFLKKQIELVNPDYVLILGGIALKSVLDCSDSISRVRGKWLEYKLSNDKTVQVLATYHPSYLLRSSAQKAKSWADLLKLKKRMEESE